MAKSSSYLARNKKCVHGQVCPFCFWHREIDNKDYCLCGENIFGEVSATFRLKIKLSPHKRRFFEESLKEFLRAKTKALEAFTKMDYRMDGTEACWDKAYRKIRKLPNIKLVYICTNIDHKELFKSYDDMFKC